MRLVTKNYSFSGAKVRLFSINEHFFDFSASFWVKDKRIPKFSKMKIFCYFQINLLFYIVGYQYFIICTNLCNTNLCNTNLYNMEIIRIFAFK